MCFGKKKTTNTTTTSATPEALANYSYINNLARTAASKPFQKYGTQASDFVAGINPQQTAGISGINASVDAYKPYFQNATAATQAGMGPAYEGIDRYMSPYIKNVADTTGALMKQQYEQAQSGALGTAASSGAFGGDRAGIAAANMQQQNQLGYGSTMANLYNQGYTQALGASQADLARQLQGGAQMAGLGAQSQQLGLAGGQAQIAAGSLQQQTEQAGKDALINQFMQEQGYPFQTAQFLANIFSMTGPAAGSQTTNTQQGSFWSDRRLKHDVERIGHTDDGQPIYRFKYNGSDQVQMGLMADQVEKHHPDAVGTDPKTGYQYVDYDRATRMAKGGVAGPYQIEIGSTPGAGGYMPENYVKPSEMLLADPSWIDSVTQQNDQRKTGLQDLIDSIGKIKDTYNKFQGTYEPKASGGSVDDKKTPQELGYLQPVLDAMKPLDAQGLAGASTSGSSSSGGGGGSGLDNAIKIVDTGIKVAKFLGFADGGVAGGRHGYALDGGVHPTHWNPITQKYEMEPVATTGVVTPDAAPAPATGVVPPDATPASATSVVAPVTRRPEPTPSGWDTFRPKVSQRESGNDPNALLGFSQREGGQFAGTNLTSMTVDQAIDFAKPGGAYANYSKDKLGRVATPMGEFQIVGTTLADAKRAMGLTGNEVMTPELQEKIAHYLYDNYGEKPWAASENGATWNGLGTDIHAGSMSAPDYEGGVKPYADRTWLGKIFHNNDAKGSLNNDAMMSLLSGVGTMLASPSPFFLPTLGAGLAAGANTYMAREGQRSDITAQNIENTKRMQTAYMQFKELNPESPMTIGQFAESHGWTQNSPYESKATGSTDVTSSLPLYKGVAPVNFYGTGGNTPLSVVDEKGISHSIPANQTYGYLTQWRSYLTSKAGLQFAGSADQIQAVDQKIADIVANQGEITAPDGTRILDPSYAQIQDSANTRQIKYKVGTELALGLQDRTDAYQKDKSNFDQLANAYGELVKSGTTQGPLTPFWAKAGSALNQIGIPFDPNTQNGWAQIQIINKKIAQDLASQGVQLTDTVTEYLGAAQPTPDLQRAAIAEILAAKAALLAREKQAITGMQGAGADAVEVWNANNKAVNRPIDVAAQQDTFNTLMQVGQESAPPAPGAHIDGDYLYFEDGNGGRIKGIWQNNGPQGPAYYGPDNTYLGTQ